MNVKRILVVDDEEVIRDLFGRVFGGAGYSVLTAASGEEALVTMKERPAMVLFVDLNLPGMNGLELCRRIRRAWQMTIPHAVTGYATLFELSDCRDAGFEDYFIKPVNRSSLLKAAEQAFEKLARWKYKENQSL
jgi:CheY-like chemotaxis protein